MGIIGAAGSEIAKRVAPQMTGGAVRSILERAIDGVPGVVGAAKAADSKLAKAGGDVERAIDSLVTLHVRLAAAEGFVTNLGGVVTMAVTMPANVAGVALIQCHLAAAILHLRGYDLASPAVRDAVLLALVDSSTRKSLGKDLGRPAGVADLANGTTDPTTSAAINTAVTGELLGSVGGKRVATFLARRIPVVGGAVGGFGDAWATRRIGRDAAKVPPAAPRAASITR